MASDTAWEVRTIATVSLVRIGSDRAVSDLESQIESAGGIMRVLIASALACAGSHVGKRAVVDIVDYGTSRERKILRRSLVRFGQGSFMDDDWEQVVREWRQSPASRQ